MVSVIVYASQSKPDKIRTATLENSKLQSVKHYILSDWPQRKHRISSAVHIDGEINFFLNFVKTYLYQNEI